MLEVKCNGKIYKFEEWDEITDYLDMKAKEVVDDPHDATPLPKDPWHGDVPVVNSMVYTHDVAAMLVEKFEGMLESKGIEVPCSDPDEQAERTDSNGRGGLYGTEYSRLLEEIETVVVSALDAYEYAGSYVTDEFSGHM